MKRTIWFSLGGERMRLGVILVVVIIFYIVAIIFIWSFIIMASKKTPKPRDDNKYSNKE